MIGKKTKEHIKDRILPGFQQKGMMEVRTKGNGNFLISNELIALIHQKFPIQTLVFFIEENGKSLLEIVGCKEI